MRQRLFRVLIMLVTAAPSIGKAAEDRFDIQCQAQDGPRQWWDKPSIVFAVDTFTSSYCEGEHCQSDNAIATLSDDLIVFYQRSGLGGLDGVFAVEESAVFDRQTAQLVLTHNQGDTGPDVQHYKCTYKPYTGPAITKAH